MPFKKCPGCKKEISDTVYWQCTKCKQTFKIDFSKLKKIQEQKNLYPDKTLLKCTSCGYGMDDGNERLVFKCSHCGRAISGNLRYFFSDEEVLNDFLIPAEMENVMYNSNNPKLYENTKGEKAYMKKTSSNKNTSMRVLNVIRSIFLMIAVICFIKSSSYFKEGFYLKEHYTTRNMYVGGDAYNYIINGNYFTGYSVLGCTALLSGMILVTNSVIITIHINDYLK